MDKGVAIGLTAVAGGLVALQAPINSGLGKSIGTFGASTASFLIGTLVLVALTTITGDLKLGGVGHLPWYYFLGGLLGATYVTVILITVRTLGAGGATAATITGQLVMSVALDRLGILGLPQRPISIARIAGVVLLAAGVFLIVRD